MKMLFKLGCLILILVTAISTSRCKNINLKNKNTKTLEVDPQDTGTEGVGRVLRKHPGCLIWWFLPGCILGDRIAVDPFGIYPWEKFCRKYSDLQKHQKCEDITNQIVDDKEIDDLEEINKNLDNKETKVSIPIDNSNKYAEDILENEYALFQKYLEQNLENPENENAIIDEKRNQPKNEECNTIPDGKERDDCLKKKEGSRRPKREINYTG